MRKLLIALLFGFVLSGCDSRKAAEVQLDWYVDFDKALAAAKEENKLLFMNFTGSDWCPPCEIFKERVVNTEAFEKFARENLVLMEIDFPRRKPISDAQRAANEALGAKLNAMTVLPTFLVLNGDGSELKRYEGYEGQNAEEFVAELAALKK